MSIHHQSEVDRSNWQSPRTGRRQFIGNPVSIHHKSISNSSIHHQFLNSTTSISDPSASPPIPDRSENFNASPLSTVRATDSKPILDQINAERAASEPLHTCTHSNAQNCIHMDRHALTQATPIYGQSEATSVSNRGTSVLQGDLPKCLDGGRL